MLYSSLLETRESFFALYGWFMQHNNATDIFQDITLDTPLREAYISIFNHPPGEEEGEIKDETMVVETKWEISHSYCNLNLVFF